MTMTRGFAKKKNILKVLHSAQDNVFSPDEFKALVKYERSRSDRNGSVFSIAVFDVAHTDPDTLEKNIIKITQFTRSIDCVGWNEEGRIAVLLPDTIKEGAEIFGKKVSAGFEGFAQGRLAFDIYAYPEHWLANNVDSNTKPLAAANSGASIKTNIEYLFVKKVPFWKRALDITGASLMLALASPVFLFTALFIKIVSPGPVFFKQTRIGFKGIPFTFWKFRTMKFDNNQVFHGKHAQSFIKDGDVPMEKLDDHDPRIILGGKVLRKSCVDELPQLWNILCGEMSLVGPRPCIPYEAQEYLRWHTHRFDTMPGLSGLWQVSGKNKLTFKQMIRLDIAYCRNITLLGDIAIILRTPVAIMKMVIDSVIAKRDSKNGSFCVLKVQGDSMYNDEIQSVASSL